MGKHGDPTWEHLIFSTKTTGGAQRQMGLYLRTFLKTLGSLFGPCNWSTKVLFTAMPCEVQLNTLQGSVITLDVVMTATIGELKSMLLEKHPFQSIIGFDLQKDEAEFR